MLHSWKNTATIQMQIEDQSFIHDGDFFLNRFPSFSENQSLMCNVHLSKDVFKTCMGR